MGALANAGSLAVDPQFRAAALAALVYHARQVLSTPEGQDESPFRRAFARAVLNSPSSFQDSISWTVAADEQVASAGGAVSEIPEELLLDRTAAAWDCLASVTPGLGA